MRNLPRWIPTLSLVWCCADDPAAMVPGSATITTTVNEAESIADTTGGRTFETLQPEYPIHIEWLFCQWESRECRPLDFDTEITPVAEYGIRQSTLEWARILAPTPGAGTHIARTGFRCYGGPPVAAGDTLPSGITIHIIVSDKDADQIGGSTCYHDVENGVPTMVIAHFYTLIALNNGRDREPFIWRNIAMHESGHGLQSGRRWGNSMVLASDSSMAWVTDSAYVAAFDALGGKDFDGPKVLTDWPWCGGCHWNKCIAPNDVMATVWYPNVEVTDLTLASLHDGLVAVPQDIMLHTNRRDECPQLGSHTQADDFVWETLEDGRGPALEAGRLLHQPPVPSSATVLPVASATTSMAASRIVTASVRPSGLTLGWSAPSTPVVTCSVAPVGMSTRQTWKGPKPSLRE